MKTQEKFEKKKKHRIGWGLLILFLVVILGSMGVGWFVSKQSTQLAERSGTLPSERQLNDPKRAKLIEDERLIVDALPTGRSYDLPVDWYTTEPGVEARDHDTIILVHGLGSCRYDLDAYAHYFLSLDFNVLAYDQRMSNDNPLEENTFGALERLDLETCVKAVRKLQSPGKVLGVWGESFGGATTALGLCMPSIDEKIDFAILDSPLSQAPYMVKDALHDMGIPLVDYFTFWGSVMTKLRLGFSYSDTVVKDHIGGSKTPLLVIYSDADEILPPWMGPEIYDAVKHDKKVLKHFTDAKHAQAFYSDTEEYEEAVEDFLKMAIPEKEIVRK